MSFNDFRIHVKYMVEVITKDLEKLENIAEEGNATTSSTTVPETTLHPDDWKQRFEAKRDEDTFDVDISRCTIPIAMVCFSIIDTLGQWMKIKHDDDFGSSAKEFFLELSNRDELKNHDQINKLKEFFRNGIMHSFFAKQGYNITYPRYETNTLFLNYTANGSTLDARCLLKFVRIGMNNLLEYIQDENNEKAQLAYTGFQNWEKTR